MSTIICSTFQDRVGGLSVPAATVQQGAAKAWGLVGQSGTQTIQDSFNVASVTDTGVGLTQFNFTNLMLNTFFALLASAAIHHCYQNNRLVGAAEAQAVNSANTAADSFVAIGVLGDLA